MYLKELTLRGFKSFASATTLRFEPGITAVVGPNGSGKSNIVDALAWVMGEQGAKTLRGTSMEDVIFAGTSTKPPLGRAQVSLTIDNTDRALDIDYIEVTISRTIFRNGGSEYAINGSACRLLDIQELLSDTGLGQQMHVIVGQGRLDAILHADPSGHRAFIEEAAGILKHRKRKERALRKLSNTESNLSRLDDLLGEIHRQMGPLGRQARISRKADGIQVSLRDAQARIFAEDALQIQHSLSDTREQLANIRSQTVQQQRSLAEVKLRIEQVEALAQESSPQMRQVNETWHDLTRLQERFTAVMSVAVERSRSLQGQMNETAVGSDPQLLEERAKELEQQVQEYTSLRDSLRLSLDKTVESRANQEKQLAAARQTVTQLQQTARQHDARISSLQSLLSKEESAYNLSQERLHDSEVEKGTIETQLVELGAQVQEFNVAMQTSQDDDSRKELELAEQTRASAREQYNVVSEQVRNLNSQIIALQAKADALNDTIQSRSTAEQLGHDNDIAILGRIADFIQVEDGWEEAVACALADYSAALVLSDQSSMLAALNKSHQDQLGKSAFLLPLKNEGYRNVEIVQDTGRPLVRSAASLVSVRADVEQSEQSHGILAAVRMLLRRTVAVEDSVTARNLLTEEADTMNQDNSWDEVLTRDGDVYTRAGAVGGSGPATSDLALVARRDRAVEQAEVLSKELNQKHLECDQAQEALTQAEASLEKAKSRQTELRLMVEQNKKAMLTTQEQMQRLEARARINDQHIQELNDEMKSHAAKLNDIKDTLEQAQHNDSQEIDMAHITGRVHDLEQTLDTSRAQEMSANMKWNEAQQKMQSLERQARLLHEQSREAAERRQRIAERNQKRQEQIRSLETIAQDAQAVLKCIANSMEKTLQERNRLQSQVSNHDIELKQLRQQRGELEPQVEQLRQREHELDIERERWATKSGQVSQRINDELGMNVDEIIREYGPDKPVPVLDSTGVPLQIEGLAQDTDDSQSQVTYQTVPYVREEQVKRLQQAKRDLASLGKVNPLATEEYESLKQRNQYLNDQRNDVVQSRDALLGLIKDLDQTMVDVFKSAFDDTAVAFEQMFSTLFPGGQGRLRLDNPDDLLTTGVLVEASPAGKRVKQLSLLSGGERSLTALALLFAIFTARPSPFYVMDEVEAALDDVNLSRLLNAFNKLREHAQLIIITHQQRTMSIADALYGVTMRSDGVTAVISQKLAQGKAIDVPE